MNYMGKVGYLKGLADGLGFDPDSKEGKLLKAAIEAIDEMACALHEMENSVSSVEEQLDDMYEEFDRLSDEVDELYMLDDTDRDDDNIRMFRRDKSEDDDDEGTYQFSCPACQGEILLREEDLKEESIVCPSCGAQLELDVGCDCECSCEHDHAGHHAHAHDGGDETKD